MWSFCQEPLASGAVWPHLLGLASLQACPDLCSLILQAQWNSSAPQLQRPFLPCWIPSALVIRSQSSCLEPPRPVHQSRLPGKQKDWFGDGCLHIHPSVTFTSTCVWQCWGRACGGPVHGAWGGLRDLKTSQGVGTVISVPKLWSTSFRWPGFYLFVPLSLPFHPGLQPNLLPFPQQQSSLLLPQTGPGLASQVNNHILPVSSRNTSGLDREAHWFPPPPGWCTYPSGKRD